MISYEATTTLTDASVAGRFSTWMRSHHIPQVVAAGGFVAADFSKLSDTRFRARYLAPDQETLDRYLANHAPKLREDFYKHFGDTARSTREIWMVEEQWGGAPRG